MPNSDVSKQKRIAAGIIGILMIIVMLFSAFYISTETGHDCIGEDCPICACVQQCENVLHKIGGGLAFIISVIAPIICVVICAFLFVSDIQKQTLISRKIRMNN